MSQVKYGKKFNLVATSGETHNPRTGSAHQMHSPFVASVQDAESTPVIRHFHSPVESIVGSMASISLRSQFHLDDTGGSSIFGKHN